MARCCGPVLATSPVQDSPPRQRPYPDRRSRGRRRLRNEFRPHLGARPKHRGPRNVALKIQRTGPAGPQAALHAEPKARRAQIKREKWTKAKLLESVFFYFSGSGLFNGLHRKNQKNSSTLFLRHSARVSGRTRTSITRTSDFGNKLLRPSVWPESPVSQIFAFSANRPPAAVPAACSARNAG